MINRKKSIRGGQHRIMFFILLISCLHESCKKVDEQADLIQGRPFLATIAWPPKKFNIPEYHYQSRFLVNDTVTLVGKFYTERAGSSIEVGGVKTKLITNEKFWSGYDDTRTLLPDSLDLVRFLISKEMGVGNSIPVVVKANGHIVTGQPFSIQAQFISGRHTDTTLQVKQIGQWLPDNVSELQANNMALVHSSSVTDAGELFFDNPYGTCALLI